MATPRALRITLLSLAVIALLILGLGLGASLYIRSNKNQILTYVTEQVSAQLDGELRISDIRPALWKSFPNISIVFKDVTLRDSLWAVHGNSLIEARELFVSINPFKLLRKTLDIRKITVSGGSVFLFTDSTGYSNTYLFSGDGERKKEKKGGADFSCRNFALENVEFMIRDHVKQKRFRFMAYKAEGAADRTDSGWLTRVRMHAKIHNMEFNTDKGSFLKDADIRTTLNLAYDPDAKLLRLDRQELRIDNWPVILSASFSFAQSPPEFDIDIQADKPPFETVAAWLSPSIYSKLDSIFFEKPLQLQASLKGRMKFRDTPTVLVHWVTGNNSLQTPFTDFTECSFKGYFLNELVPGMGHSDSNTVIVLQDIRAKWGSIPFHADSVRLENLVYPLLEFSFSSSFALPLMNDAPATLPFRFDKGQADVRVYYKGGVRTEDTLPPYIRGHIRIQDGAFAYTPRSLVLKDTRAELVMEGDDLYFRDMSFRTAHSSIKMHGSAGHFFRFYFADPGRVSVNWKVTAPIIDLRDFTGLIGRRSTSHTPSTAGNSGKNNKGVARLAGQLDQVMETMLINLDVKLDQVRYRNFDARDIQAGIVLSPSSIALNNIRLRHAGGSISLNGQIDQEDRSNPFRLTADISQVAVDRLLYAFDHFGQQTLSHENIQGQFSAKARLSGRISDSGRILEKSLKGQLDFSLENGALVNFEPLLKVSRFAFKKRELSNVVFKNISNKLEIDGEKILIPPMTIASSALYIHLQGIYGITTGTDIALEIPLRNPRKDGFDSTGTSITAADLKEKRGLRLNLRAQDDETGKVKISWDPGKKGQAAADSLFNDDSED